MGSLNSAVSVAISRQSQFPSLPSYNTIMIAGEFLKASATPVFTTAERVRVLTGDSTAILASLLAMFGASSPFYTAATQMFLQNPTVNTLYIGRKLTGADGTESWSTALTAMNTYNSAWYGLLVFDRALASQQAIATWIEANGKISVLDSADPNIPGGAGDICSYLQTNKFTRTVPCYKDNATWRDTLVFTISGAWVTGNKCTPTIMGAALGEVDFATTSLAMMQALQVEIAAAYPSATVTIDDTAHTITLYQKGFQWDVALSGASNTLAITGGVAPTYLRTYPNDANEPWFAAALTAYAFALSSKGANVPGSVDWCYLSLVGQTADNLTPTQISTITGSPITGAVGKNGNIYTAIAGVNVFQYGFVGNGERIDVIIALDYLSSLIQNNVFTQLINRENQPKVPYTDAGIQQIVGAVNSALQAGVAGQIIANPNTTYPLVASVSSAVKATRALQSVAFTALLTGSIQTVPLNGVVTY